VIVGGVGPVVVTVRVAAFVVAFPNRFVNTALYLYPFSVGMAVNE
jgi:hypothetical protein